MFLPPAAGIANLRSTWSVGYRKFSRVSMIVLSEIHSRVLALCAAMAERCSFAFGNRVRVLRETNRIVDRSMPM